jgi:hypothetical protein
MIEEAFRGSDEQSPTEITMVITRARTCALLGWHCGWYARLKSVAPTNGDRSLRL